MLILLGDKYMVLFLVCQFYSKKDVRRKMRLTIWHLAASFEAVLRKNLEEKVLGIRMIPSHPM